MPNKIEEEAYTIEFEEKKNENDEIDY